MASEDVLHRYAAMLLSGGSSRQDDAALMGALAAEVRELRRDKARLDWLQKEKPTITRAAPSLRAAIDAAMGGEG